MESTSRNPARIPRLADGARWEYLSEFSHWFSQIRLDEKLRYTEEHPEPAGWEGFYARRGAIPAA